jgi:hypothetical protein
MDFDIQIQLQDKTGNWRTFNVAANHPQRITQAMKELAGQYPDKRVRAVDSAGRLVDIL